MTETKAPLIVTFVSKWLSYETQNISELPGEFKHGEEAPDKDVVLLLVNKTKILSIISSAIVDETSRGK